MHVTGAKSSPSILLLLKYIFFSSHGGSWPGWTQCQGAKRVKYMYADFVYLSNSLYRGSHMSASLVADIEDLI